MGKVAPKATDEESPIYDYCMVLAERRAQSAELICRGGAATFGCSGGDLLANNGLLLPLTIC